MRSRRSLQQLVGSLQRQRWSLALPGFLGAALLLSIARSSSGLYDATATEKLSFSATTPVAAALALEVSKSLPVQDDFPAREGDSDSPSSPRGEHDDGAPTEETRPGDSAPGHARERTFPVGAPSRIGDLTATVRFGLSPSATSLSPTYWTPLLARSTATLLSENVPWIRHRPEYARVAPPAPSRDFIVTVLAPRAPPA